MFSAHKNIRSRDERGVATRWLNHYYRIKTMKKLGIAINPSDINPFATEVLTYIELQFNHLRSQDLKRQTSAARHKRGR